MPEPDVYNAWNNTRAMLNGVGVDTSGWEVERFAFSTENGGNRYRWILVMKTGDVLHPVERHVELGASHAAACLALGSFYTGFNIGYRHTPDPSDDLRRQQIFARRNALAFEREWRLWSERATSIGIKREKLGQNPNDVGLQLRDE